MVEKIMPTEIKKINDRLDFIEFRQELLFSDTELSRLLFEYNVNKGEYLRLMDLMDKYRNKLMQMEEVDPESFEEEVYEILPQNEGNYHFCECLTRAFMNEGRWEEIFPILYGYTAEDSDNDLGI